MPVLTWAPYLYDDLAMSDLVGGAGGRTDIEVVKAGHPLAAGRAGNIQVTERPTTLNWGSATPEGTKVATVPQDPAKATVFAYRAGDAMADGDAPARRVGIFLGDTGINALTPDGMAMFDATVYWSTGRKVK